MTFAARLVSARQERNWTQVDLSKRTGLKPSAIGHFEQGTRLPSFENLRRLCKALGADANWMLDL